MNKKIVNAAINGVLSGAMAVRKEIKIKKQFIDLHLHLDGSISVNIARKLAKLQNIILPTQDEFELMNLLSVPADCNSLNDYLKCFELPLSLMQTTDGISEAVYLVQEELKKENVIYVEIRFAPQFHTDKGLTQQEVVEAALEGLNRSDLRCNLILCCMRGEYTHNANLETVEVAHEKLVKNDGVVAIDLAGAEALYPTYAYDYVFRTAQSYNIPYTIHAGEADGPASVQIAVDFGAARIGHGVRAYDDKAVMQEIIDKRIPLEMCPTSNMQTKSVESIDNYPIMYFLEKGVMVTVNTDNMAISRTTVAKEFEYLKEKLGLSDVQEKQIILNSINAAFTDTETKNELKKILNFKNNL